MADDVLYLALDQGGHASRALVFDSRGRMAVQEFALVGTQRHPDGRIEHDPEEIIRSFQDVIAATAKRLEETADPRTVVAAGLATQRSSIVCWKRDTGAALSPVISWQD